MNSKSHGLYKEKKNLLEAQLKVHGDANTESDRWQQVEDHADDHDTCWLRWTQTGISGDPLTQMVLPLVK